MSDSIPEKGVCRIDFENTSDKEDCLDAETESDSEQSEVCIGGGDSELEYENYYNENWKGFSKRKFDARQQSNESNAYPSEDESGQKRRKLSISENKCETETRPQLQLRSDIPSLLENDNNTILRSFSHNDNDDKSILKFSESFSEITETVRKLTEGMVLPINHQDIRDSFMVHHMQENEHKKTDEECESTPCLFKDLKVQSPKPTLEKPIKKTLRKFRIQKIEPEMMIEILKVIGVDEVDKKEQIEPKKQSELKRINPKDVGCKNFEIQNDHTEDALEAKTFETNNVENSNEDMDFNMAVEALNLLKNKGKSASDEKNEPDLKTETHTKFQNSDKATSTVASQTFEDADRLKSISNTEELSNKQPLIFDTTLEITDCKTGAKIPFESIYSSASEYYQENGEKQHSEQCQRVSKIPNCEIPNVLTQLTDTVKCLKVTLKETLSPHKEKVTIISNEIIQSGTNFEEHSTQKPSLLDKLGATSLEAAKVDNSTIYKAIEKACKSKSDAKFSQQLKSKKRHQLSKYFSTLKIDGQTSKDNIKNPRSLLKRNLKAEEKKETPPMSEYHKSADNSHEKPSESSTSNNNVTIEKVPTESEKTLSFEDELKELKTLMEKRTWKRKFPEKEKFYLEESVSLSSSKNSKKYRITDETGNYEEFRKYFEDLITLIDEEDSNNQLKSTEAQAKLSKNSIRIVETPLEGFNLFINDAMIHRIVNHTNEKLEETTLKTGSRVRCYKKPISVLEMRAFIGLLLISSALKHNDAVVSEIWSECFGAGIYRAAIQEGRFKVFLQNVSFGHIKDSGKSSQQAGYYSTIGDPWEEFLKNIKTFPMVAFDVIPQKKTELDDSKLLYTTVRKTTNFSLRVLFNMLDCAIIRGLAIFHHENPNIRMDIRDFLKQVGMSLVTPFLQERLKRPMMPHAARELILSILNKKEEKVLKSPKIVAGVILKKQKRCQLCPWNKDRKTKLQCFSCRKNMCKEHRAHLCIECADGFL